MTKVIPGSMEVLGREFFYLQIFPDEEFSGIMDNVLAQTPEIPLPKYGGIVEELVELTLSDKTKLHGVSYRGDLEGWRNKLTAYCKKSNRKGGIASNNYLSFTDGAKLTLSECNIVFNR